MLLTTVSTQAAHAVTTRTWTGATNTDWGTAANWGGTVPSGTDIANIPATANAPSVTGTEPTLTDVRLGSAAGTMSMSISGAGKLTDTNGYIGYSAGSNATATVSGSSAQWNNSTLTVGSSGTGTLNIQSGGTVSDVTGGIASTAGSFGTVTVDGTGSTWTNSGTLTVGGGGTGTLNIQNGGTVNDVTGGIASTAGSFGTVAVTGTGSKWTNSGILTVGNRGTGTLNILSGGTVSDTGAVIGGVVGSTGTATVSGAGSSWINNGTVAVGSIGTGTLIIQNGGAVSDTAASIGAATGGIGSATVSGSGSHWNTTGNMVIGSRGNGTLNIQNSGNVSDVNGYISTVSGSAGTATITGTGSNWLNTGNMYVGYGLNGIGALNILNGGSVNNVGGIVGNFTSSTGTASVGGNGSTWNNSADLYLGYAGNGSLTLSNGGTLTTGAGTSYTDPVGNIVTSTSTVYIAQNTGSVGTLNIGAAAGNAPAAPGTLNAASVVFGAGTGTINFNHTDSAYHFAPSISGNGTVNLLAGTTIFDGALTGFTGVTNLSGGNAVYAYAGSSNIDSALSGASSLTIASGGTTYLTSDSHAFTGNTGVSNGSTLSVNGSLGGDVTVADGGTLKGHGTIDEVTLADGSIIAPGNSIGTLTVGTLTTSPNSIYQAEINVTGGHDLIHVTGGATLNGGHVDVSYTPGTYLPGLSYTILTADGGRTGIFSNVEGWADTLFIDAMLSYDANNAYLNIVQFQNFDNVALTANQQATARAAQSLNSGNNVYDNIVVLNDPAQAQAAFDSLSGEVYASAQSSLLGEQHVVSDLLLNRLNTIGNTSDQPVRVASVSDDLHGMVTPPPRNGPWIQGFGDWQRLQGNGNSANVSDHSSGVLIGQDAPISDHWQAGAAVGYSVSQITDASRDSRVHSDNYHAAVYAGMRDQGLSPTLRVGSSITWSSLDGHRDVTAGALQESLNSDYDALTSQTFVELAKPVLRTGSSSVAPFANVSYLHQSVGSFTEDGGSSALSVDDASSDLWVGTLGARAGYRQLLPDADIKQIDYATMLGWQHTAGDLTPNSQAHFASGGDSFSTAGVPLAHDAFVYDVAVNFALDPKAAVGLRYAGQLATTAADQSVTGNFSYKF